MGNKLENIIRSVLKDDLPAAESWNTPSSEVWERIEEDLKGKNKPRGGFLWFCFGIVAFVVFGLLLIRQCSLMDRPSDRLLISSLTIHVVE